jgi:hypothetical protein
MEPLNTILQLGYVGPGAGLSMIGALLAVLAILALALIGPILYPIKLLRVWLKQRRMRLNSAPSSIPGAHVE